MFLPLSSFSGDDHATEHHPKNTETHTDDILEIATENNGGNTNSSTTLTSSAPMFTKRTKVKSDPQVDVHINQRKLVEKYGNIRDNLGRLVETVRKNIQKAMSSGKAMSSRKRRGRARRCNQKKRKTKKTPIKNIEDLQNCVPTARAVMQLLRDPEDPFSESAANDIQISTTKANDFSTTYMLLQCDGCKKKLWSEDIYRSEKPTRHEAWCEGCADKRHDLHKWEEGTSVQVLTITAGSKESKKTAAVFRESEHSLFTFTGEDGVLAEVIDGLTDVTRIDKARPCVMYGSGVDWGEHSISRVLSKLRRQRSNGMMCGLICLRFKDREDAGNEFHAMNFLLGPGVDREVFFIDACAKHPSDR